MGWPAIPRCRWESPSDRVLYWLPERTHPDMAAGEASDPRHGPPDRLTEPSGVEGTVARQEASGRGAAGMRYGPAGAVRSPPRLGWDVVLMSFTVFRSAA